MIVDGHVHLVSGDVARYPLAPIEPGAQMQWSKGSSLTVEALIDAMDEADVDQAVVVQAATVYGYDNSYIADSVDRHRDRLIGVGTVNPRSAEAPEQLRHLIGERGLHGIRLFSSGSSMTEPATWLDDTSIDPYWLALTELDVPVEISTRLQYLPLVRTVLERHPRLRVVISSGRNISASALAAGPPYAEAEPLFRLAGLPNVEAIKVYFGLPPSSERGWRTVQGVLAAASSTFGASRTLWGSNFPASRPSGDHTSPYKEIIEVALAISSQLPAPEAAEVMGGTARRVFAGPP